MSLDGKIDYWRGLKTDIWRIREAQVLATIWMDEYVEIAKLLYSNLSSPYSLPNDNAQQA